MTTTRTFTVMTLNTWQKCGPWEERWRAILDNLDSLQPDVVAFQELFDAEWRDGIARRAGYPFVAPVGASASGLVLLSRVPLGGTALQEFAARSPRETYSRYLLRAEVFPAGRKIHVFNTHLSWMAEDEPTRLAQVREIAAEIKSRCAGEPVLVLGDLNAAPHSPEVRWLLENAQLLDCFQAANPSESGFTWNRTNPYTSQQQPPLPDRRIDYVLAAGQELKAALTASRVVCDACTQAGIYPSDHYGVLCEFALDP